MRLSHLSNHRFSLLNRCFFVHNATQNVSDDVKRQIIKRLKPSCLQSFFLKKASQHDTLTKNVSPCMPIYRFRILSHDGSVKTGRLKAKSKKEAYFLCAKSTDVVLSLRLSLSRQSFFSPKNLYEKLASFFMVFLFFLQQNTPLLECLSLLEKAFPEMAWDLQEIQKALNQGRPFSESCAKTSFFNHPMIYTLLRMGEKTGSFVPACEKLRAFCQQKAQMQKKRKHGLSYPFVLCILFFVCAYVILAYVLPELMMLFNDMQIPISGSMYFLSHMASSVGLNCLALMGGLIGLLGILYRAFRPTSYRLLVSCGWLIPWWAKVQRQKRYEPVFYSLSLLLAHQIALLECLVLAQELTPCAIGKAQWKTVEERLGRGEHLHQAIQALQGLPSIYFSLIELGERTNQLPAVFQYLSDWIDSDYQSLMSFFQSMLQPMLLLLFGILFLFLIQGTLLPFYQNLDRFLV